MTEKPSTSLDARTLLTRPADIFHAKKYEISEQYSELWKLVDFYMSRMEPISGYPQGELPPLERYSPEYRETRRKLILSITRTPGFDIKNIDTASITAEGMLNTYSRKGELLSSVNLIE